MCNTCGCKEAEEFEAPQPTYGAEEKNPYADFTVYGIGMGTRGSYAVKYNDIIEHRILLENPFDGLQNPLHRWMNRKKLKSGDYLTKQIAHRNPDEILFEDEFESLTDALDWIILQVNNGRGFNEFGGEYPYLNFGGQDWDVRFGAEEFGAESKNCPKCDSTNLGKEEMPYCYNCGNWFDGVNGGCSKCDSENVGEEEMDYCYTCGSFGHWYDFGAEGFGADGAYMRKTKSQAYENEKWGIFWEGDSRYRWYGISLIDNPNDVRIVAEYDANATSPYALSIPQPDDVKQFRTFNELLEHLDNMMEKGQIGVFAHGRDGNRMRGRSKYPTVGDWTWYGAESFEATKGMDTYAQPLEELKIKPTKTKVGILLASIVAGGLWYSNKMKE